MSVHNANVFYELGIRRVLRKRRTIPCVRLSDFFPPPRNNHQFCPYPTSMSPDLSIRALSKTYPNGTRALKSISLDVPPGMFGLLGRNGAGKSTLMRILATLQEPDAGTIHLGDLDVVRHKERVRETLGYLPQSFGFHPRIDRSRPASSS